MFRKSIQDMLTLVLASFDWLVVTELQG
uniref:Uncharacterized protein n=1 Tax=Arundo donax TaxID=35708 RepID=A0A0A9F6Q0_ARUDO